MEWSSVLGLGSCIDRDFKRDHSRTGAGSHRKGQGRRDWNRYPQSREGDRRMELMEIWKSRGPLIEGPSACSLLHLEP